MSIHPEELARLFLTGDDRRAHEFITDYLKTHSRQKLFTELLTPAMIHIGDLWERNEISVADEHLATATCDFVLSAADFRRADFLPNGKIMLLGVEGEEHYLGLKMVASLFRENGWLVHNLGPNMPLDHALSHAEDWEPDAIGLSASLAYRLPAVRDYAAAFRRLAWQPAVLIGGRITQKAGAAYLQEEGLSVLRSLNDMETWIRNGGQGNHDATATNG